MLIVTDEWSDGPWGIDCIVFHHKKSPQERFLGRYLASLVAIELNCWEKTTITLSIITRKPMGTDWFLNREEETWQIGLYQSKEVRWKPSKVRAGEQSKRRQDAIILDEPSLRKLSHLLTANPLIFCINRPSNCKRNRQNWYDFNSRCMPYTWKPITSWFKTASNWHKMRYSHPFTQYQRHRTGGWWWWACFVGPQG